MRKVSKKTIALVASLALLLCVGVGGTLAFLFATDGPVENTFEPSKVTTWVYEEVEDGVKKNVKIQNTGDIDAYIRAAIVVTWQNEAGDVLAQSPKAGTDYELKIAAGWNESDGFYYWPDAVEPNEFTGVLISSCKPLEKAPEDGYYLNVQILGSGIQSVGIPEGSHPWYD